jgi:hypothetical protein
VYQSYVDSINHSKTQQWLLTYYILLLQAGIVTIYKSVPRNSINLFDQVGFVIIALIIAVMGSILLLKYQRSMYDNKKIIYKVIYPKLSGEIQPALDHNQPIFYDKYSIILITLISCIWFSCFFALWFMMKYTCEKNFHDGVLTTGILLLLCIIGIACSLLIPHCIFSKQELRDKKNYMRS